MSNRADVPSDAASSGSVISIHSSSPTNTSGYSESLGSTVPYSGTLSVISGTTVSVADPAHERTVALYRDSQQWLYLFHIDNLTDPGNPRQGLPYWSGSPPGVTSRSTPWTVHPRYTHISRPQIWTVHRNIPFTHWPARLDNRVRSYFTRYRDIRVHRPPHRYTAVTTGRTYWCYFDN
jgi:hypothetical protein